MPRDADIIRTVRGATEKRSAKSAPAEKAIHIPLPFDAVMSAVLKVKPEPKAQTKTETSKRPTKKPR